MFKPIAEWMLSLASFVQEEYVTGETVPTDGTYAYVKHAPGARAPQAV